MNKSLFNLEVSFAEIIKNVNVLENIDVEEW